MKDSARAAALDARAAHALHMQMAAAHPPCVFYQQPHANAELILPALVAAYQSVYDAYSAKCEKHVHRVL